jgi:hypothetical protein
MRVIYPLSRIVLVVGQVFVATQCTPAHAENQTIEKPYIIGIINNQNAPQFDGLGYSAITLAKSNVRIGVLLPLDVNNRVFNRGFCLRACPIVMMGRVEVSKDTLFTNGQYANSAPPSPLDWRLLVMGFNQSLGVTNHAA